MRFLNAIEAEVPAGKMVHVILDNYAAHKHPKVRAWLDRHERFVFPFTPTSCSWLNAVEGFFARLSRRRLKRGVFRSVVDLQAAINRFLAETNAEPKPFTWTADPDKIIAAVRRGHQALNSIHYGPMDRFAFGARHGISAYRPCHVALLRHRPTKPGLSHLTQRHPRGTRRRAVMQRVLDLPVGAHCGVQLLRRQLAIRTSVSVLPSICRVLSMRANALRPGNSWYSASPWPRPRPQRVGREATIAKPGGPRY